VLFFALLLTVGMPLVGCDQVGQNEQEDGSESEADVSSEAQNRLDQQSETTRLVASTSGFIGADSEGFALYVEEDGNRDILHVCAFVDDDNKVEYVEEENSLSSASVNGSDNLVEDRTITKGEDVIYSSKDEGKEITLETFDITDRGGVVFKVTGSNQSDNIDEGNFDYNEATDGVPTNTQQCRNRSQFIASNRPTPSREDLVGTWRLNSSSPGPNNVQTNPRISDFEADEDDSFALFYEVKSNPNNTVLHSCTDEDGDGQAERYNKEVHSESGTSTSDSYLDITQEVETASGVLYENGSEGNTVTKRFYSVSEKSAVYYNRGSSSNQTGSTENVLGVVGGLEKTDGVPRSDSDCQNRDKFIQ